MNPFVRPPGVLVAITAFCLLAACSRTDVAEDPGAASSVDTASPGDEQKKAPSDDDAVFDSGDSKTTITILDAGAEPRRELRYRYVDGSNQGMTTRLAFSTSKTINGVPTDDGTMKMPTIAMPFTCQVVGTDAEGSAKVAYTYGQIEIADDAPIDRSVRARVEAGYHKVAGSQIEITQSNRGEVIYVDASDVEGVTDAVGFEMNQRAGQAVPLPLEPLGVGARWVVVSEIQVNGRSVAQTATQTLTASEGDHLTIIADEDQQYDPAEFSPSDSVPVQIESTGTVNTAVDLTRPCPTAYKLTLHQVYEAPPVGDQTVGQTIDVSMSSAGTG